ncbi:fimbrial protein [Serratia bockelmannii]|uniref:fimbrial protein n=1 Tax=Serratia bockelmannii TaxID=2703793 RepID=UPI0011F2E1F6|nr:fimbrial protein [Serratia bockelmannii]MBH3084210.1 fimbrial protein [Serratia marcescens]
MNKRVTAAFIFMLAAPYASLEAVEEVKMTFRGGLIAPPPCTINGGKKMDVDFGDRVGVNKVDGERYRQTIGYSVDCEPGALPWQMTLTLKGNASFERAALQTNKPDLGIRIYQNDTPFIINTPIPISPSHLPVLEAVPVAKPGMTLTEGAFSATATLQADYQ